MSALDGDAPVRLRPSRLVCLGWTALGVIATGLAGWLVIDTAGHGLAVALAMACLIVTLPFAAQLVAPGLVAWYLDGGGLVVRRPWGRRVIPWSRVRLARVVRVAGDAALELHLLPERAHDPADAGALAAEGERCTVRLPTGTDLAALHRALATHLGPLAEPADDVLVDGVCSDGGAGPGTTSRQ